MRGTAERLVPRRDDVDCRDLQSSAPGVVTEESYVTRVLECRRVPTVVRVVLPFCVTLEAGCRVVVPSRRMRR